MNGFSFDLLELWRICGAQLILLGTGLLLMFMDLWLMDKPSGKRIGWMGWVAALLMAATLGHMVSKEWNLDQLVFMDVFSMDRFSAFVAAVVLLAGIMSALLGIQYLKNNGLTRAEFFVLLVFAVYGTVAMVQSVDLLMVFITLEIMSISIYVLAAYLKGDRASQEGAFKYFLLGSFGSAFFLFGMALLYGLTGTVNLTKLAMALSHGLFSNPMVLVALAMIMGGLLFKISFVPFHMWTPDVYEGAPSVVTGFMATAVKAGAFGIFIKILAITFSPILVASDQPQLALTAHLAVVAQYWKPVIWWLSLLTMFFGNLLAINQFNVKRMLAYSSIAHAGYMGLGVLAASDGGRAGVLFYLLAYTIMNVGAFAAVALLDGRERTAQTLDDYRGLGYRYPALSFALSLFLVAMAGLPPTAGFTAKFYVFSAAIERGYLLLAALGILTSAMGAYYYLRVLYYLYMKEPVREVAAGRVGFVTAVVLVFACLATLYLGVFPDGFYTAAQAAQKSLALVF